MYFANPTGDKAVHAAQAAGLIGYIDTPLQKNHRPEGLIWCADNGCFNSATFKQARWWKWLQDNAYAADTCVFATAPDVLGDAEATLKRSRPWLQPIRQLGYPAAFVAQDGLTTDTTPWGEFDVLFIGGTDTFKLGADARALAAEAVSRGLYVHMGRVNGGGRYRYAEAIGCQSADGTKLIHGPSENLRLVLNWVRDVNDQPALFGMSDT